MALNSDYYAIVIGIDNYAYLPRLWSASRDAQAFTDWLLSSEGGSLPPSNIALILSPSEPLAEGFEPRPRQWEVDRALLNFGATGGERLGKRLYFYFSGHAFGTIGDMGLMMADASPQSMGNNLGLYQYRQLFRRGGLFEEVVYVLDCSRSTMSVCSGAPSFVMPVPQQETTVEVADLLLILRPPGRQVLEAAEAGPDGPGGVLTRAVMEGLRGEAADAGGHVTTSSLGEYVRERVRELTATLEQTNELEVERSGRDIVFTGTPEDISESRLVVEVPHWTAQVRIYDDLLRPVPRVGSVTEAPEGYQSEMELRHGIYQVEVSLGGQTEQKLVLIRTGRPTRVELSEWKSLKPAPAALLTGSARLHGEQTRRAKEWSHKMTWGWPGRIECNSGLFLFVSSLETKPGKGFADGLALLDADGRELVTLAGEAVQVNGEAGWMAFCAELPAGYYVLHRRRRGLPNRYQPIYLCPDWQTQAFVPARRSPLMRELTLNMAPRYQGFQPDEATAVAVAFVIDSLRHGGSGARVVLTRHVSRLLEGERRNPWLGLLAAYALLRSNEIGSDSSGQTSSGLFQRVLTFLQSTLGDHPDVAALSLQDDQPAFAPILRPPLLRYGLQRVQHHAIRFKQTIPVDSLTDYVLDALETNSPWTAWRDLVRMPRFGDTTRSAPESDAITTRETPAWQKSHRARRSRPAASSPAAPLTISDPITFAQAAPPSAPIFRLAVPDREVAAGAQADSATAVALSEAPLIGLARDLVHGGGLEELPEAFLDPAQSVGVILQSLTSREVSAASGLPLDRAERALEFLRQCALEKSAAMTAPNIASDSATEAEIAPVALEVARHVFKGPEAVAPATSSDMAYATPGAAAARISTTIEECVAKLRAEARRVFPLTEEQATRSGGDAETARTLSERLLGLAGALFTQADFVVITDASGRMERGNGAFQALLGTSEKGAEVEYAARLQAWQGVFQSAPLGYSTIMNPASIPKAVFTRRPDPQKWELRRAAVEGTTGGEVKAYMNFLRIEGALRPDAGVLVRVDGLLSRVTMFASLYALGSAERREEYAQELDSLVAQLEGAIWGGTAPAGVPVIPEGGT